MPRVSFLSVLCPVSLLCLAVLNAAGEPGPADSGATIRTTVHEVALDLVVRDNRGRIVKNLQPSDVEVYENGVKQQVRSVRLMSGHDVQQAEVTDAGAPAAGTPFLPLRAVNLVCIVFHDLDSRNLPMKKYTMEAAQEFVNNQFPPDTWVGVFSLGSGLTSLLPFTTNHNEAVQAAKNAFMGRSVDFATSATAVLNASPNSVSVQGAGAGSSGSMSVGGGAINSRAVTGADVASGAGANAVRGDMADARRQFGGIEGARNMDQITTMIQMLGQLPGRKSVLLLSPGLTQTGDPDKLKEMENKANRANITIYALDTTGMTDNSVGLASGSLLSHTATLSAGQSTSGSGDAGSTMESMRQQDYLHDAVRTSNTQAPMRALSEATGGFLIANTNDLRKSFQHIVEDVDTHYEVVYHPSSDKYDGRFRSIEVKLARADLNVQGRQGYFALPDAGAAPLPPFETAALTALSAESRPHAFDFRTAVYQFRPGIAASEYALAFEVPAANLTATPDAQQKRQRLHVALLALVKNANGQVVDKISQDFPFEFTDEQMASARADVLRYSRAVKLPPGHYSVDTALVDRESNRTSTATLEFDNAGQKGLGMSSVVLVQGVQPLKGPADPANPFEFNDRRVAPEIATDLKTGSQPFVYFVVYPDKSSAEKPKIQVEFLNGGQPVAKQAADLPAPDATGAIPMVVGAPPKPGRFELKITATQGTESVEQSLKYTVAAKQ